MKISCEIFRHSFFGVHLLKKHLDDPKKIDQLISDPDIYEFSKSCYC